MSTERLQVESADGLRLDVARYRGGDGVPVLCIPGLTRNRRDFDEFANWLSGGGRDVFAISLRGRGASEYDPDYLNYHPETYRDDVIRALDQLDVDKATFVGTSLGGIVTFLVHEKAPSRVAAAIINDIGPELAPEGIARIAGYAGGERADAGDLDEAANQIRAINEIAFPDRDPTFWRDLALKTYCKTAEGRWRLDYDQAIGRALIELGPAPDLWPSFLRLRSTPTLLIRGALSDLLTAPIVDKMRLAHPSMRVCEVSKTGHAPTLTEPESKGAIDDFLSSID